MNRPAYEPPAPGTWELDCTHLSRPLSRYTQALFTEGMPRGFREGGDRFGTLLSYLKPAFVNGFLYMKGIGTGEPEDSPGGPPPEGFFSRPEIRERLESSRQAIAERRWRGDLRRWDTEVKPDSIRRNAALQAVRPGALTDSELREHLVACRENAVEMVYRHHVFTFPSIIPTGAYLARVCAWADIPPKRALALLRGSTPVSAGVASGELAQLVAALESEGVGPERFEGQSPAQVVAALERWGGPIGEAFARYVDVVGDRLVSGYDVVERTTREVPEVLVGVIWAARARAESGAPAVSSKEEDEVRQRVPPERRAEFDEWLAEARLMNRLRDERGVFNEALGIGLARRAILEAGRRLHAKGRVDAPALLLMASHDELMAMLDGAPEPTSAELAERAAWIASQTTDDAPPFLGPAPQPPPPLEAIPEAGREMAAAIGMALGNLFDAPAGEKAAGITGLPVSPGIYEGTARIVVGPEDFHRVMRGDVLVTKNTSATFNVVIPLLGALVTDRGGQLSHAAIVAREFGIPGVVGTRTATKAIADGVRVRVDGDQGTVDILR